MAVRVVIADDHRMMREMLRARVEMLGGYEVVGEAEDGRQAVQLCGELEPDVILMDLRMPELNGVEAARALREASSSTRVIAISMHAEYRYVTEAFAAGVAGYVLKDAAFNEMAPALESVLSGGCYLSPALDPGEDCSPVRSGGG